MEEKKYTKTKIFLFLLFAVIFIVLFTNVYLFVKDSFHIINKKNNEISCLNLKYDIYAEVINSNVYITIFNNFAQNITKITFLVDDKSQTYDLEFKGKESIILKLNITKDLLDKSIYYYLNDCENKKEMLSLKKI
ncbi:MAG: hypothetical protein QXE31_03950 [Candidatus Woesearchaeota archaeon]